MLSVNQNILRRKIAQKTFVAGGEDQIDLVRTHDLHSVMVRISGTVTHTTADATSVKNVGVGRLLNRIELFSDGTKTLIEGDGRLAAFGNFERCLRSYSVSPIVTDDTANPVEVVYMLDLATMDGPRPKDSALHTRLPFMSLLTLRLGYVSDIVAALFVPGSATLGSYSLTVEVFQIEVQEFSPADMVEGRLFRRVSSQEAVIDADNSSLVFKLPVGNMLRGVKFMSLSETDNAVNTIINNVVVRSAANVRLNMTGLGLRRANLFDYNIPLAEHTAGVYFADLCPTGHLNQLFDLRQSSNAEIEFDVTKPSGGNGRLLLQVVEYIEQPAAS